MKETGRCFKLHGRLYVIVSSFFTYLNELGANQPYTLQPPPPISQLEFEDTVLDQRPRTMRNCATC